MQTLDIGRADGRGATQRAAMLRAAWPPLAWWLTAMAGATAAGYPGAALSALPAWAVRRRGRRHL